MASLVLSAGTPHPVESFSTPKPLAVLPTPQACYLLLGADEVVNVYDAAAAADAADPLDSIEFGEDLKCLAPLMEDPDSDGSPLLCAVGFDTGECVLVSIRVGGGNGEGGEGGGDNNRGGRARSKMVGRYNAQGELLACGEAAAIAWVPRSEVVAAGGGVGRGGHRAGGGGRVTASSAARLPEPAS